MTTSSCHVCMTLCIILVTITTTIYSFPAGAKVDSQISELDNTHKHSASNRIKRDTSDYNNYESYAPRYFDKRGPQLSINQDLMSIASMLRNEAGRRRMAAAENFLHQIGKRSYEEDFDLEEEDNIQGQEIENLQKRSDESWNSYPFKRPTRGRLSVNMPLDALSQMIHQQRRHQYSGRVEQINRKLSRLG